MILYGQKMDISSTVVGKVTCIARLTGMPLPEEEFMSPNGTVQQWNIGGTDLGIIWEQAPGKYGILVIVMAEILNLSVLNLMMQLANGDVISLLFQQTPI